MMVRASASLLLLLLFAITVNGQELDSKQTSTSIPFELTSSNNLLVDVRINERDNLKLMFHTASGAVFITESGAAKCSSVEFDHTAGVKTWGGSKDVRYSAKNTLRIGERTWRDIGITEDKLSGKGSDGKFGFHLFPDQIVEINFDRREIFLHPQLPANIDEFEKLKLIERHENYFIEGFVRIGEESLGHEFLLHSGFSGALLFDNEFARKQRLVDRLSITGSRELRDSLGNVIKTNQAVVPTFRLGVTPVGNVPVEFFEGTIGERRMSILGADLLRRFNWVFDPVAGNVYVRSSQMLGDDNA
ncbi:MAG: hypothetical protein AAFX06_03050 [Planctomycetota bacterium]